MRPRLEPVKVAGTIFIAICLPQEVDDLRRRMAAMKEAAETRRQSLLAEKAKAQNALGQLAITREKAHSLGRSPPC